MSELATTTWEFTYFTKTSHHDTYPDIDPTQPKLSAAGKHVVVTGGGSGIGKSIAISFAKAGAASVAIMSRRRAVLEGATKDIAAAGPKTKALFATADATDRASVDAAFKSITDQTGRKIDILISNAGALGSPCKVADSDPKMLSQVLETNVVSSLNIFQAFLPYATNEACILNTSSGIGHFLPAPNVFAYAMSKAAGIKLFDYIAAEHPSFRVINVQPGVIATEMNEGYQEDSIDTLELPGHFYVWLASAEAAFLKSKYVWVNWDVKELMARAEEIRSNKHLLRVNLNGVPM